MNQEEGIYIYCIIDNPKEGKEFKASGIGGRMDRVYTVSFNGLGAVVSRSPKKKYQALRENLMPHESVVAEAMQEFTTLPVRFCTVAKDEAEVIEKGLKRFEGKLKDLMEKMRGKVELGMRVMWTNMDLVFAEIAQTPEIIKMKSSSNPNLMGIGRRVEELLKLKKEQEVEALLSGLKVGAVDYKQNSTYGDNWILSAAFLVEKEKENDFDKLVEKCQNQSKGRIKLKYVGPWAPYNFANVELIF